MIFSLAHPYGTPTILSSYSGFTDTDAGAPNGGMRLMLLPTRLSFTGNPEYRNGNLHYWRWRKRLAMPTPLDRRRRHDRVSQPGRLSGADQLGVAAVGADRVRPR
jgi:hypothetical protein